MSPTAVRRSVRMSVVAIVVALTSLVVADRADAHSALIASTPADGQTLTEPIDRVDLTFSEAPLTGLDAGLRIEVRDAAGQDVSTGEVLVDGTTMSKAVTPDNGAYTVLWRYVSPDGHPITGQLGFTVALPEAAPTSTPSASAGPGSTATETDVTIEATAEPTADDDTPVPVAPALWAGGGALVLLATVVVIAASRRRRAPDED
ncbi:copper resistance CopC family protein [Curtobacterium sp. VKM Ac-2922]|uniref:copper resistance CopC family protein n=1 Tax=Curtobacterium sp. VKM Ac-2922 TaxID=2929475 RepID=UPI001FB2D056|nr:copper resistance CopC family protein [Curtobacterium sp. VKM Ac-2922]MCJ1714831.1 copper resistance protein CopC [Curtobacterium sp. VKM Ac-2922]